MIRNIATVIRGTVMAQAVGVLVLPVLTRLFDPAAFGHLQLYLSVLTLLIVVPSLRYDIAILRATDAELPSLLRLCLYATAGVSALLLVIAYGLQAAGLRALTAHAPFPLWMPVAAMASSGIAQVLLYVAIRDENFRINANSKVAQALFYAGGGVTLGVARVGINGLILADMAGRLVNLAWLYRWFRGRPSIAQEGRVPLRTVAKRYREYPLVALPGGIANSAGGVLTPIMIYATFTATVAGQYGLVDRVLTLPVALIAVAVSQTYMGQLSAVLRDGAADGQAQFYRLLKWLGLLGAVPTIIVMLFAAPVFVLLFGAEWRLAGTLAQIMAPAAFSSLLAGCFNMTLSMVGRQKTQIAWEAARLLAMITLWSVISALRLPVVTSVLLHSGLVMIVNCVFLFLCHDALRQPRHIPETQIPIEGEPA